jgi:shikimate O-hydroxycinnamoyltransferase
MSIEIIEQCMVTAAGDATPQHRLWLSNLDLLVARSHTPTVYFYHRHNSTGGPAFFSPGVLKAALSRALVTFYPLAGRLARDGAGRPEIRCTGEGALFVTARTGAALHDLGDFAPAYELQRMLVPSASDGQDRAGILAMFQVMYAFE